MKNLLTTWGAAMLLAIGLPLASSAADGTPVWTNYFNGVGNNGNDAASAIAVDAGGNTYVTGYSDPTGISSNKNDYATIKYSSAGVPQWTQFFNGAFNGRDEAKSIAVDGSGNVYVTGTSAGNGTSNDFATIKYSSAGVLQWTQIFNGAINGNDEAKALALDGSGNVYVTGTTAGSGTGDNFITLKYSSAGVAQWTNFFNGAINGTDRANALAVDGNGNVYVTGTTAGSGTSDDYATVKYSSAGVLQWTRFFNGAINGNDQAIAIAVDGGGDVFVTGTTTRSGTSNDFATLKYSSAGTPQWTNFFNGAINGNDSARAIAMDGSGNVYVTGTTAGSGTGDDFATIKYSSAGVAQWTRFFNGAASGNDQPSAIDTDANGNVYVTGMATGNGTSGDYATIKYASAGVPVWTNLFRGAANGNDRPNALVVSKGNVYVTGSTLTSGSGFDYATIQYFGVVPVPVFTSVQRLPGKLVLSWDAIAASLQFSPLLGGTFTNIIGASSPYTNDTTSASGFFRLVAN